MDIYKRLYIKSIYHSAKICGRIPMMIINELQRYLRVVYMQKKCHFMQSHRVAFLWYVNATGMDVSRG